MNVERLEKKVASIRIGGKGSTRRKKNSRHNNKTEGTKGTLKTTTGDNGKQQPSVEEISKSPLGLRKSTCDDDDSASDDEERIAAIAKLLESEGFHDWFKRKEPKQKPVGFPPFWLESEVVKIKVNHIGDNGKQQPSVEEISKSPLGLRKCTCDDNDSASDDEERIAAIAKLLESEGFHDWFKRKEPKQKPVGFPPFWLESEVTKIKVKDDNNAVPTKSEDEDSTEYEDSTKDEEVF